MTMPMYNCTVLCRLNASQNVPIKLLSFAERKTEFCKQYLDFDSLFFFASQCRDTGRSSRVIS